jgi:hypothetical protein
MRKFVQCLCSGFCFPKTRLYRILDWQETFSMLNLLPCYCHSTYENVAANSRTGQTEAVRDDWVVQEVWTSWATGMRRWYETVISFVCVCIFSIGYLSFILSFFVDSFPSSKFLHSVLSSSYVFLLYFFLSCFRYFPVFCSYSLHTFTCSFLLFLAYFPYF